MGDKNGFELSQAQKRRSEDREHGEHEDGRQLKKPSRMRACIILPLFSRRSTS
jgi:hypothetical protein